MDLLASQQLEKCSELAAQSLADIERFLASDAEFRDPKEFRRLFQDVVTPETKSLINQVPRERSSCQEKVAMSQLTMSGNVNHVLSSR